MSRSRVVRAAPDGAITRRPIPSRGSVFCGWYYSFRITLSFSRLKNNSNCLGEDVAVTRLFLSLLMLFWGAAAQPGSARMQLEVRHGVVAEAEYWPGAAAKPAVLILHGFLQTREFPTVRRLASTLAKAGYSVLTPTLTLGVNRRQQSLACEAIHTHSIGQDVNEIAAWVGWLAEHAGKPPVLVGHSTGGVQLTALLASNDELPARHALMISLDYFDGVAEAGGIDGLRARVESAQASDAAGVYPFALNYCQEYVTTPGSLLSYLNWDADRLKGALLSERTPTTVITGGQDERIDRGWVRALRAGGIAVRSIPGANHFFDQAYELELFDEVVAVIEEAKRG